jgi:hypothetical protein
MSNLASPPAADFDSADVLLSPPETGQGHWVGAPCVHRYEGSVYLAARWRTPDERGYQLSIYERSDSADQFTEVTTLTADELDVVSIERAALCTHPRTGALQCYLPVDRGGNDWVIQKLADVDSPAALRPETARTVLAPEPQGSDAGTVKDPVVAIVGGRYYMYYAGFDGVSEQAHLATSVDGETWTKHPNNPLLGRGYWHDHHVRVSTVVPSPDAPAWLVFYGGSGVTDEGRTWNLRTGVAVSPDLERITDTSPNGPYYVAPTADRMTGVSTFATCRYLDILRYNDRWELFAEVAREDGSFELRHITVHPSQDLPPYRG